MSPGSRCHRFRGASWAAAVTLAVALWPGEASGYRPFNSSDAAITPLGEATIELGLGLLRVSGTNELVAPHLVLNLGFWKRWEAVLEGIAFIPLEREEDSPRFRLEGTGLFLKALLREGSLQEATGPSLATEFGILLPTVNGERGVGLSAAFIVSQRWAPLTAHLNVQALVARSGAAGLFGGLILEGPDRWAVRPVGEVFMELATDAPRVASGLLGAIWRVQDNFSLDLAFRMARLGTLVVREVRFGFTLGLSLWGKE